MKNQSEKRWWVEPSHHLTPLQSGTEGRGGEIVPIQVIKKTHLPRRQREGGGVDVFHLYLRFLLCTRSPKHITTQFPPKYQLISTLGLGADPRVAAGVSLLESE